MTPLTDDERKGRWLDGETRGHTRRDRATVAALLMVVDGAPIAGRDTLIDGGVRAAHWFGELAAS